MLPLAADFLGAMLGGALEALIFAAFVVGFATSWRRWWLVLGIVSAAMILLNLNTPWPYVAARLVDLGVVSFIGFAMRTRLPLRPSPK